MAVVLASMLVLMYFVRNANADTGAATLTSVDIIKVGTGLAGEDDTHVLINNTVVYEAIYSITTPGTVTLMATFPINNTIDAASVSSSAGCATGSALSKSAGSQTNNVATCILDTTAAGSINWSFSAKLWGANDATVAPVLAIAGVNTAIQPDPITLVGAPNYVMYFYTTPAQAAANGVDPTIRFGWGLYAPLSANGVLGLEPILDGNISFEVDTSSLPTGWTLNVCGTSTVHTAAMPNASGGATTSVVYSGNVVCTVAPDSSSITITISGAAIGVAHYPTLTGDGQTAVTGRAYYSVGSVLINSPVSSLLPTNQTFPARFSNFPATTASGEATTVTVSPTILNWTMNNLASGNPRFWFDPTPTGFTHWYSDNQTFIPGQSVRAALVTQLNTVPMSDAATDMYWCATWNGYQAVPTSAPTVNTAQMGTQTASSWGYEFGVIDVADSNTVPSPLVATCGKYSDGAVNFFNNLADAQTYATANSGVINAVRLYFASAPAGIRDLTMARMYMSITNDAMIYDSTPATPGSHIRFLTSAVTNEWTYGTYTHTHAIAGGLIRAALGTSNSTATSPNIAVGGTQHVTLTPSSYGQDTNVTATVTLPAGLNYVTGSGRYNSATNDPIVTVNGDGTTTLVFSLGTVGAVGSSNAAQPPLTFDVVVSTSIVMPRTVTITNIMGGDGTTAAPLTFRSATTSFSVAAQASFGFTFSQAHAVLEPGDTQIYNFAGYNTTDSGVSNLTAIVVLPYNGDGRGSTGITSYQVSGFSTTTVGVTGLTLYYTTSTSVRSNPSSGAVPWVIYSGGALPAGITAVRWVASTLAAGKTESVEVDISNIVAVDNAVLATDVTYISTDEFGSETAQSPVSAIFKIASITGTVYRDVSLTGYFTPGDTGLSGQIVNLMSGATVVKTATTNSLGQFTFTNVSSGTYTVIIASTPASLASNLDVVGSFVLAAGGSATDKNIGFVARLAPTNDSANIEFVPSEPISGPIQIPILANDVGPGGVKGSDLILMDAPYESVPDGCSLPTLGTVDVIDSKIYYTPDAEVDGVDEFCYQVGDSFGQISFARVRINLRILGDCEWNDQILENDPMCVPPDVPGTGASAGAERSAGAWYYMVGGAAVCTMIYVVVYASRRRKVSEES